MVITDYAIIRTVQRAALAKDIKVPPAALTFCRAFIDLLLSDVNYDEQQNKYYVQYSVLELADLLKLKATSMVASMDVLCDLGLLERVPTKSFPHTSYVTLMDLSVFKVDDE